MSILHLDNGHSDQRIPLPPSVKSSVLRAVPNEGSPARATWASTSMRYVPYLVWPFLEDGWMVADYCVIPALQGAIPKSSGKGQRALMFLVSHISRLQIHLTDQPADA